MVKKKNLLVTGSKGQLGTCLRKLSYETKQYNFIFADKKQLDISKFKLVENFIEKHKINIIINCAAYTNVEKAEKKKELANLVNHISVENLAKICNKNNIQLIHISTDFVFDGKKSSPYNEIDTPNPINYYGLTKLKGENKMMEYNLINSVIIRTSWLYSDSKNNFVTKIYNQIKKNSDITTVDDEIGSPTNSMELANLILTLLPKLTNDKVEIYHFSNLGSCSRYNFANEIKKIINGTSSVSKVNITNSKVNRPKYSVLDSSKLIDEFDVEIEGWRKSLSNHLLTKKEN